MTNEQLDLIKKLIALANNNPNEHEANAASRKVCVLLEEVGFTKSELKSNAGPAFREEWQNPDWSAATEAAKRQAAREQQARQHYSSRASSVEVKFVKCKKCGYTIEYTPSSVAHTVAVVICGQCKHYNRIATL